jgi:hypothetical protein
LCDVHAVWAASVIKFWMSDSRPAVAAGWRPVARGPRVARAAAGRLMMLAADSLPAGTRERRRAPGRHRGQQTIGANRTLYVACPGWWIDRDPLACPVIRYLSKAGS